MPEMRTIEVYDMLTNATYKLDETRDWKQHNTSLKADSYRRRITAITEAIFALKADVAEGMFDEAD